MKTGLVCLGVLGSFVMGCLTLAAVYGAGISDDKLCECLIKIGNPNVYKKIEFYNTYGYCKEFLKKHEEEDK